MIDTDSITNNEMQTDTVNIGAIMAQYQPIENDQKANFEIAKKVLLEHYKGASKSVLTEVLMIHLKEYFKLEKETVRILKPIVGEMLAEAKVDKKQEKKDDKLDIIEQNLRIKAKRDAKKAELFDILSNKDGKSTVQGILFKLSGNPFIFQCTFFSD